MGSRFLLRPRTSLLVAGALCIALLTGCPVPQQPRQPSSEEEPAPTLPEEPSSGQTTEPLPPVTPEEEEPTDGGGGGGGTPGGETGVTGNAYLGFVSPFDPTTVTPDATVDLVFTLAVDARTTVTASTLIVARDDNSDALPDTTLPAYEQDVTGQVVVGQNRLPVSMAVLQPLLSNGFGRFLLGLRVRTSADRTVSGYARGTVTVDAERPTATFIGAGPSAAALDQEDHLRTRTGPWVVRLVTADNSPHLVRLVLDPDLSPLSGNEVQVVQETLEAGVHDLTMLLSAYPVGTYYYYYHVTDGLGTPAAGYAVNSATGSRVRLALTDRLVGDVDLNELGNPEGAIFQGYNFNDLAGSSIAGVPDLNGDGLPELLIAARFGKPLRISVNGIGFGEAYLIYGSQTRLAGVKPLNAVGDGSLPGLAFRGIRMPVVQPWTEGLADVTVLSDMDGDNLPELVFSFPRTESLSLASPQSVTVGNITYQMQDPRNVADIYGMGGLELDPVRRTDNSMPQPGFVENVGQFTRGGVVIVSSQNAILRNALIRNRKLERVIDLHEVGQLFTTHEVPALVPYLVGEPVSSYEGGTADCDGDPNNGEEHAFTIWSLAWDVAFANQTPGGFLMPWTVPAVDPPLAYPGNFAVLIPPSGFGDGRDHCRQHFVYPCDPCADFNLDGNPDECHWSSDWVNWTAVLPWLPVMPCTTLSDIDSWDTGEDLDDDGTDDRIWSGFYGGDQEGVTGPYQDLFTGLPSTVGARVLGQAVNDHFGISVSSTNQFLFVAAPDHTATSADVPALQSVLGISQLSAAGTVYAVRIDTRVLPNQPTQSQLWIEPGMTWPNVDAQGVKLPDYTMPVPHNYIIRTVGSLRSPPFGLQTYTGPGSGGCPPAYSVQAGADAVFSGFCDIYQYFYFPGTAGDLMARTIQIVGPHAQARLAYVRGVGDFDGDGIEDFAVGSENVRQNFSNPQTPTGATVGGIFVILSRSFGLNGDVLLSQIALPPEHPQRLNGLFLKGESASEKLARVFDAAGDFNGDGYADILIGSEGSGGGRGLAMVLFGSPELESPAGGWTVSDILADPRGLAVAFRGVESTDAAGANVAGIGDVDADGFDDILIAAPGAEGGKGAVYLIYGSPLLVGEYSLDQVGTVDLPGARFIGRNVGDQLGGGTITYPNASAPMLYLNPNNVATTVYSRGVARLGDLDGDGNADFAISAMLADPNGRTNAGEVYLIYGRRGP